ncbi:MAG TPA: hypothetical protein VFA18_25345, partial [Gemmataceae bacterium]|nr:hypothetical protein [Gemmataceae bacterium]
MLRFLAMLLWLAWASTALGQPAQRRPSVDGCGDPLPDGAVAHWGTAHFRVGYGIAACSLSADGRWLAVTAPVNHVDVLDAWTGKRHWFGRSICANDPLFSADSRYVLCGDEVGVLVVREAATGKVFGRFSLAIDRRLRSWFGPPFVALSADARTLALGFYSARDQQRITARDVPSGQVKFQRVVPVGDGVGIALSPDGQLLSWWGPRTNIADEAVSKAIQQHRRTLHLFKLPTGQELHQFKLDRGHLNVVLFSPDGK